MSLQDDLKKLVLKPQRGTGKLPDAQARDAIPSARGDADYESAETGGGIRSPLTELAGTREYFDERTLTSSDGVFVIVYSPIKKAEYEDDAGDLVVINYVDE